MADRAGPVRPVLVGLAVALLLVGCAPQPSPTPQPTATSAARAGWDLTADNVGLASVGVSCDDLPTYWGPSTVLAGTTISGRLITTPLNLAAGGITIERSCIRPVTASPGLPILGTTNYNTAELRVPSRTVTIRDSDIDGTRLDTRAAAEATAFVGIGTLTNNLIHGFGSGIALMNTGTSLDALIEHNVVTGLVAWGDGASGNHSDAFTIRDFDASQRPGRRVVVRNNRFDCDSGHDTGALFVQTQSGRIDNLVVERNLLEGGGYQLGLNQTQYPYANVEARDNRFSGTGYGPAYVQEGPGWSEWGDNYLVDPAAEGMRGSAVPRP